jgi:hypothetical protein
MKVAANTQVNMRVEQNPKDQSREFPVEPQTCWECTRGKILCLPFGKLYVDCPPANWKRRSCVARLLETIERPSRSFPDAIQHEESLKAKE